jgi:hypothetical protein
MSADMEHLPYAQSQKRNQWPGEVSLILGTIAALLLGYAIHRKLEGSPFYLAVCVIGAMPSVAGAAIAVAGLMSPARRRLAIAGLIVNGCISAGLVVLFLRGPGIAQMD